MFRYLLFAIPAAIAPSSQLAAQIADPTQFDSLRGELVRLRGSDVGLASGRLITVTGDTLLVKVGPGEHRFPAQAIDSLWVGRRSTGRGAAVGGVVGATAAGIYGAVQCHEAEVWPALCAAVGAPLGALGGVVIGGLVGHRFVRWRLRYVRN